MFEFSGGGSFDSHHCASGASFCLTFRHLLLYQKEREREREALGSNPVTTGSVTEVLVTKPAISPLHERFCLPKIPREHNVEHPITPCNKFVRFVWGCNRRLNASHYLWLCKCKSRGFRAHLSEGSNISQPPLFRFHLFHFFIGLFISDSQRNFLRPERVVCSHPFP